MLRPDIGRNYDYFSKVAIKRGNIWVTSLFFCVFCSMLTIYDTANEIRFQTPINKGSKRVVELMGSDYVLLKFSVSKPIYFQLGDWCDVPGFGRFELVELYNPTYNKSTGGYDYELELEAYYCKWRNKIFKYTPETGGREASWSLTATLDVHLGVFVRNLKALGYKYNEQEFIFSIDSTVTQSAKLLTYNNTDMITALNMMAEAWECEWWIEDHVIYFGRCEIGTPIDFEQGVNVADISSSGNKNVYATRIYAFGSTRNIPVNYRPVDETVVVNGMGIKHHAKIQSVQFTRLKNDVKFLILKNVILRKLNMVILESIECFRVCRTIIVCDSIGICAYRVNRSVSPWIYVIKDHHLLHCCLSRHIGISIHIGSSDREHKSFLHDAIDNHGFINGAIVYGNWILA
mgnify:CR=1 FL=1